MALASAEAVARHPHLAEPVVAGRVRVDLHAHTMWSGDSTTTPDEFAAAIISSGLDVVCVTDHNAIAGACELRDRVDCRIIIGEELRTAAGEIIGLFLSERVPMGIGHLDAARAIRDQGGIVYIPHPFDPMRRNLTERALRELAAAGLVDAIEVLNAKTSLASLNRRASEFADEFAETLGGPLAGDGGLVQVAVVQHGTQTGQQQPGDAAERAHAHGGEGDAGGFLKLGQGGEVGGVAVDGRGHAAGGGIGRHRPQGHDHHVVVAQRDVGGHAVTGGADAAHRLAAVGQGVEIEVGDAHAHVELHALLRQPAHDRPHDGIAPVVARRLDQAHRRQVGKQPQEAQQVAPQLGRAVPGLEAEHAAPHAPEVGGEEVRAEAGGNRPGTQRILATQHEADQVDPVLVAEPERRSVGDLPMLDEPRLVAPRGLGPERQRVLRDRPVRRVERRDAREQFMHQGVGRVAGVGRAGGVEAAAQHLRFEDAHARARQVAVADQVDGGGQRGDAAAHQQGLAARRRGVHRGVLRVVAAAAGCRRRTGAAGLAVVAASSSKAWTSRCARPWASGTAARAVVKPKPIAPA